MQRKLRQGSTDEFLVSGQKRFIIAVAEISGVDNIRGNACGVLQGHEILSNRDSFQVIPNDHPL